MAGTSLLALIDDIASLLDDVALMTKVAAKNTAGVLGDDLALNAQQVSGVNPDRELPVVWAVGKGSFKNKLILVPLALLISAVLPWAVTVLLMVGGAYLCFEGFEKLAHKYLHPEENESDEHGELVEALANPEVDIVAYEQEKIKGAIRTDFVLSAEIITIALGTVAEEPFGMRVAVLSGIAVLMTVGVYGFVAAIVKLDDAGLYLTQVTGTGLWQRFVRSFGAFILKLAPYLLKFLSVAGTIAMFMVGGGILTHGIPWVHELIHHAGEAVAGVPAIGHALEAILPSLLNTLAGVLAGALVLGVVNTGGKVWKRVKPG